MQGQYSTVWIEWKVPNKGSVYDSFWISKLLYLDFQILLFTEVVIKLSHDHVALFKTFRGTVQNYARQTINHAASRIKQVQLQLFD